MDGGRDTEMAVGAYQPSHTWRHGNPPRGQVHGFRMSLWYEHLGRLDNRFLEPWSLECVTYVQRVANELWDLFSGPEVVDLPGHLLRYPIEITPDGMVTEIPDVPCFLDTKASIMGKPSSFLPHTLTT